MNKKLKKQIKAYAGFAGALLAVDKTDGQVVYVDINPDTLVAADPVNSGYHHFFLDVDNDSVDDFDFRVYHKSTAIYTAKQIFVSPQNSNQIGNKTYNWSFTYNFPAKLNQGDTISANGNWQGNADQCLRDYWFFSTFGDACGVWDVGTDKFLAFRLFQNSNYYYGWLRIEILTQTSFLLKEYAYNTLPNIQLPAGFTALPVDVAEKKFQFNFSQQNNSIHISTFQKLNHANISVYDLLGKEILQQPFEEKETTIKIDKKGIYFVEVKSEKGIFRKKIFIY